MPESIKFCGFSKLEHARAGAKWGKSHLLWYAENSLPGVLADAFAQTAEAAFSAWSTVCGLTFERTRQQNRSNVILNTGRIDGQGSTLAWSYMPPADPVNQLYDLAENWNQSIDLLTVMIHEIGHALGLDHGRRGVMKPSYTAPMGLQSEDINRIQELYGKPKTPPAPTPPTGNLITIQILNAERIEIPGYEVRKL